MAGCGESGRVGGGPDRGSLKAPGPLAKFWPRESLRPSLLPWPPSEAPALREGRCCRAKTEGAEPRGRQGGGREPKLKGRTQGGVSRSIKGPWGPSSPLLGQRPLAGTRRDAPSLPAEPGAGGQRRFGCPGCTVTVLRGALRLREVHREPDACGYPPARPRRLVPAGAALLRGTGGDPRRAAARSPGPACDCPSGALLRSLLPQVAFPR